MPLSSHRGNSESSNIAHVCNEGSMNLRIQDRQQTNEPNQSDIMPNRYDWRMQFKVVIINTHISITNVQQPEEYALVWFTDWSKMDVGVGVEVTAKIKTL